ncbi:MAG: hypothetical protein HZC28_18170 [Spirochaetes bacterium]|nr:hypothetical protein [Spirochaetota bacterium]
MSQNSFKNVVQRFANVKGLDVQLTLKSGRTLSMSDFSVRGNNIVSGTTIADMDDINYVEVTSNE